MQNFQNLLEKLLARQDLTADEMTSLMQHMMSGQASNAQIAAVLIALRMKGETVLEISSAASVMQTLATPVELSGEHIVDLVGTGGDGLSTFNISTASAIVVAAAGAQVAKHGNRSVSSKTGSADVLEAAGVNLNITAAQVAECVGKIGIGFMFAPRHHPAMKHAIETRRDLGVRTLFNLLGPLSNPAHAKRQLIGVYDAKWLTPFAEVLQSLGSEQALVVHSQDGLDEISIGDVTEVAELKDNHIKSYQITPEEFGIERGDLSALRVNDANESLAIIQRVFDNQAGPARDIVALNAGAGIYVAGLADSIKDGVQQALALIANHAAQKKFSALIQLTQSMK